MAFLRIAAAWSGLLRLEQDVRTGDDCPRMSGIDLQHVIKLRERRGVFTLLAIEIGAANSLVVAWRVLGVVQDRGNLSLGQRPLPAGDVGGDQLPAVVTGQRAILVAALQLLEPADGVVKGPGAERKVGQCRLGGGKERRPRIELLDRLVADDGFQCSGRFR